MILPRKHITLHESLLGLSSYVLEHLEQPKTVDELWGGFTRINNTPQYPAYQTFDNFVLAIDFLYMSGKVSLTDAGEVQRC